MKRASPLSDSEIASLAKRQLADYDNRTPGTMFADPDFILSIEDAYRVQIRVAKLRAARGEGIAGYKIGCVSPDVRRQLGVEHPVFGHVFRSEVHTSPAVLREEDFCNLAVEGEVAVRLAESVPSPERLAAEPSRYVGEIFPIIELHHHVLRGPRASAAELVANNALQAGVVVPATMSGIECGGPVSVTVSIGDRVDACAEVDPAAFLSELTSRLTAFGIRPRRGDLLLTGSPLPLYPASAGDRIVVSGSGAASVIAELRAEAQG